MATDVRMFSVSLEAGIFMASDISTVGNTARQ
jgi:hypothetical protein